MPTTFTPKPKQELREPRAFGRTQRGEGPEIPSVPDNYYLAMIKDVKEATSNYGGESKDQYVVEWELMEVAKDDGSEITLRDYITIPPSFLANGGTELNENSTLYAFLKGLGYTDENLEVDPSQWQGKTARINVVNKEVTEGDNKGKVRPKIKGYSAVEKAKKLPTRQAPAPARQSVAPAAKVATPARAAAPAKAAEPAIPAVFDAAQDDDESF